MEDKGVRIIAADSLLMYNPNDLNLLLTKVGLLKEKGDLSQAADMYSAILASPTLNIDASHRIRLQVDYLYILQSLGRYSSVIHAGNNFLSGPIPDSLRYMELPIRMFIMNVAVESGQLRLAKAYLDDAKKLCDKLQQNDIREENLSYARTQLLKGEIIYAIRSNDFSKIIKAVDSLRSSTPLPIDVFFDMCLPIAYDGMGQPDYAETLYKKILAKEVSPDIRLSTLNNYTHFLLRYGRPGDALKLIEDNMTQPAWIRQHPSYVEFVALQGEALGGVGKYEEAYRCMDFYRTMTDSIKAQERQGDALIGIEQLKVNEKFDLQQKNLENYALILKLIAGACIALICVMGIWLWKMRYYRGRMNEAEHKLAVIDESNQVKLDESNKKIEGQQRELIGRALEIAKMSGAVEHMNDLIADSGIDAQGKINSLKLTLKEFKSDKDIWETFRIYFELTNPRFIRSLHELCPDLTQKEIRMCAFVLMNLTSKEIANITQRVPRSVETMKYRLAKKLEVPTGKSLHKFLSELAGTVPT